MIFGLYHSETETAGLLRDMMKEKGLRLRDVHLSSGDGLPRSTGDLEGLIVMGGPMNVDDIDTYPFLQEEVRLIEEVLAEKKPVLGICLGAQLIAKALGAKVYANKEKELGWHPVQLTKVGAKDPLFSGLPESFRVLQWHGDTFDLPKGAVHLARSEKCENQAFRWGDQTYALQFHLEVTPGMLRQWVGCREGKAEVAAAGEDARALLRKSGSACLKLRPVAERVFSSYLNLAFNRLQPA